MSLPRSSSLFALPSAHQTPVDGLGYESLSIEELLSLVPSLKCETFDIRVTSFFRKGDVWQVSWSRDDARFSTESKDLRAALLESFEHLHIQRARLV
jgi:hypothetical protein